MTEAVARAGPDTYPETRLRPLINPAQRPHRAEASPGHETPQKQPSGKHAMRSVCTVGHAQVGPTNLRLGVT